MTSARQPIVKRVCVFGGTSDGKNPWYAHEAYRAGFLLARHGIGVVSGGEAAGLMKAVADGAMDAGGEAIGVITRDLADQGFAHQGLTRLETVADMHERKARMTHLADGYLALPGGLGTLEELFDVWTWSHLRLHHRPYALLNTNRFFGPLLTALDTIADDGFIDMSERNKVLVDGDPEDLIRAIRNYWGSAAYRQTSGALPGSPPNDALSMVHSDRTLVELVDSLGENNGEAEKPAACQPPGRRHRAFSVFLFDDQDRMVLQRRAKMRYHSPALWSSSCCGHPLPGETPFVAAARRTAQELGRSPSGLEEAGTVSYTHRDTATGLVETELNHLFAGRITASLAPDSDAVDATALVDPQQLQSLLEEEEFTPWFSTVLAAALPAINRAHPRWSEYPSLAAPCALPPLRDVGQAPTPVGPATRPVT